MVQERPFWFCFPKTNRLLIAIMIAVLLLAFPMSALAWTTAIPDGVIDTDEYGSHVDGQNQHTNGGQVWYLTWDDANLYVGVSGAIISDAAVIYIDTNPLTPINGGNNTDGNLNGQPYDGTSFAALQFRADFVTYFQNTNREYRIADGAGGWSAPTTTFGVYGDNGSDVRELSIPWSVMGGRPTSFAWFGYLTTPGGFVYGQVPAENSGGNIGTSAYYSRYYIVNSTADGASTYPFSRNSYVFNGTSDITDFGAVDVYDFTVNTAGRTITRAAGAGGNWTIAGDLRVDAGTVDFGASSTLVDVAGDVLIGSSGTLALSSATGGDLQIAGDFTQDGTFTPNSRTVFFNGSSVVSSGSATSVDFDYIIVNNSSVLQVADNFTVNTNQDVTNNGEIANDGLGVDLGQFHFLGSTFTNNGAVTIYEFAFVGSAAQSVAGAGTWTGDHIWIRTGAEVSLAEDITFSPGEIYNEGTASGSNTWRTSGAVGVYQGGTFTAPFEVVSGVAVVTTGSSQYFEGLITVDTGAELQVLDNEYLHTLGDVVVNGEIANDAIGSGLGGFRFGGGNFTNNGAVTIYEFAFVGSTPQLVAGAGTWTGDHIWIQPGAEVSLADDITFSPGEIYNEGTIGINSYRLTINSSALNNVGILTGGTGTVAFDGTTMLSGTGTFNFHNLEIAATGNLTSTNGNINVSGDWRNSGAFNHNNGQVSFNGSTSQNLILDVPTTFFDLAVSGGTILVETNTVDNASVSNTITNSGTIRKTLTANGGGGLTGVQLAAFTGLTSLQIDRVDQSTPNATTALDTGIHWLLTPSGSGSVTITLPDSPPGFPPISDANRACYDSGDGHPFTCADPASLTASNMSEATLLANPYWAVGANASPTAVMLMNFDAESGKQPTAWIAILAVVPLFVFMWWRKMKTI